MNEASPKIRHVRSNWQPTRPMDHFIVMTPVDGLSHCRVRADCIKWLQEETASDGRVYTAVSTGDRVFFVEEPVYEIIQHIEDSTLPYRPLHEMTRKHDIAEDVAQGLERQRLPSYVG